MPSSRDAILQAVRSRAVPPAPTPIPVITFGIRYDDPLRQYGESLAAVGGTLLTPVDAADAHRQLEELPYIASSARVCSLVPGIGNPTVDLDAVTDPHELETVEVAILRGEFAIAENAAIWFPGRNVKHRVLPFITQHLVLVVPRDQIVHNMHEAYERLQFTESQFGVFISGPSKTADIEQSLVIGAHGPRSLAVIML